MAEHPRKITTTGQVGLVHPNGTSTAVSATGTGAAKIQINVGTGGNINLDAQTLAVASYGAKATASVTLIAWGSWADGATIAVPGVAAHTIKKTSTGDIDVSGAATIAEAAAIVGAYMAAHAGSLVDYVDTVGQVMTFRAKAYGHALNGKTVSGTLLLADVAATNGAAPYDGKIAGEVMIDAWHPTADATAHSFAITPSAWRKLCLMIYGAQNPLFKILVDGSAPSGTGLVVTAGSSPSSANWSATNVWQDSVPACISMVLGSTNCLTQINVNQKFVIGKHAIPTVSVGVEANVSYPFVGNSNYVELWGVPK